MANKKLNEMKFTLLFICAGIGKIGPYFILLNFCDILNVV